MAKRKSRRKAPRKAGTPKLDTEFDCPFCCATKKISVVIRKKDRIAYLMCSACRISYETPVSLMDDPVDVFSAWIDSCEEVNNNEPPQSMAPAKRQHRSPPNATVGGKPVASDEPQQKRSRLKQRGYELHSGEDEEEDEDNYSVGEDDDDIDQLENAVGEEEEVIGSTQHHEMLEEDELPEDEPEFANEPELDEEE